MSTNKTVDASLDELTELSGLIMSAVEEFDDAIFEERAIKADLLRKVVSAVGVDAIDACSGSLYVNGVISTRRGLELFRKERIALLDTGSFALIGPKEVSPLTDEDTVQQLRRAGLSVGDLIKVLVNRLESNGMSRISNAVQIRAKCWLLKSAAKMLEST